MAKTPRPVHADIGEVKAPSSSKKKTASKAKPVEPKNSLAVSESRTVIPSEKKNSLSSWFELYLVLEVGVPAGGEKAHTFKAKRADLERFLNFFASFTGGDDIDQWTKSTSKRFLSELMEAKSPRTGNPLKRSSIERVLATLGHVSKWIHSQRPFLAGLPLGEGKSKVKVNSPKQKSAWKGLPPRAEGRLRSASEQLVRINTRSNQRPIRNQALLFVALNTALRPSEILDLDLSQFDGTGFNEVRCKGQLIIQRVPLGKEAAEILNNYIDDERGTQEGALFQSKTGKRLTLQKYNDAMKAIAAMANRSLPEEEKIEVHPHLFRHHTLKKMAQNDGIEYAHKRSNHISNEHIFRYLQPSDEQLEEKIQDY